MTWGCSKTILNTGMNIHTALYLNWEGCRVKRQLIKISFFWGAMLRNMVACRILGQRDPPAAHGKSQPLTFHHPPLLPVSGFSKAELCNLNTPNPYY